MTIEEQITIFEHNAEHERKEGDLNNCLNFRQLAEWLKELKAHREAWEKVRAEIDEQYDRVHPYNISCAEGLEMALEIIDKYMAEGRDKE